ncbi:hypothetical protein AWB77_06308 [Caballeronia fortuita]|uniref:Uncharacterized protein n=1 Tax=Caballeronia fortuita TaxID=1777138 RepID=A0A158E2Y2_9BURK|nr:hypothetical protein [Caballeronia fortuita]SAL01255.1 hypothetical protein AWB77_06308 [Caballeronia fortuita]
MTKFDREDRIEPTFGAPAGPATAPPRAVLRVSVTRWFVRIAVTVYALAVLVYVITAPGSSNAAYSAGQVIGAPLLALALLWAAWGKPKRKTQ